jgi:hypothetical protein
MAVDNEAGPKRKHAPAELTCEPRVRPGCITEALGEASEACSGVISGGARPQHGVTDVGHR